MEVRKRRLALLEQVYAVGSVVIDGRVHFVAATEGRGRCLLFSPPDWRSTVVWEGPGGSMGVVPVEGRDGTLVAIQDFYPVFQSERAGIVYAQAGDDPGRPWRVRRVIDLPFVHRIDVVRAGEDLYLVAASLCGRKAFTDDWSSAGVLYRARIPEDPSGSWNMEPVVKGITKNHGLHVARDGGTESVFVSGQEGVYKVTIPGTSRGEWHTERVSQAS